METYDGLGILSNNGSTSTGRDIWVKYNTESAVFIPEGNGVAVKYLEAGKPEIEAKTKDILWKPKLLLRQGRYPYPPDEFNPPQVSETEEGFSAWINGMALHVPPKESRDVEVAFSFDVSGLGSDETFSVAAQEQMVIYDMPHRVISGVAESCSLEPVYGRGAFVVRWIIGIKVGNIERPIRNLYCSRPYKVTTSDGRYVDFVLKAWFD